MTFFTGDRTISVSRLDKFIFAVLVVLGIQSALYFAEYWFFGDHRRNIVLFVILSYAIFRGIFRSITSWMFFLFVSIPKQVKGEKPFSVDVLTTAMPGEPYAMFETTLTALAAMHHPHTTYLLDGGNSPELVALCEKCSAIHVDCTGIDGAKGGKINYCLSSFARGELVMVIDPDHIPQPEFIDKVIDSFSDENVGFVQVVQPYYNRNESDIAYAAAEQGFGFYGPLQMGLDGLEMSIAIGANCIFRRKALDSIQGHAIHLAEDACTSLRLHAQGWKSRYVPYRASYGLVPSDLSTFFKQQLKWATGMFQLFSGELPKVFSKLKVQQKAYYLFAGTYYLNGVVTGVMILLPIVFLFLKLYAIEMPFKEYVLHLSPYIFSSFSITLFLQRWYSSNEEVGFPWRSMLLEKGSWFVYTLALYYTIMGRKVVYFPTPKSRSAHVSPTVYLPNLIAICTSGAAILFALTTYQRIDGGTILMMFFAALNIITLLPCIIWSFHPSVLKHSNLFAAKEIAPVGKKEPALNREPECAHV